MEVIDPLVCGLADTY